MIGARPSGDVVEQALIEIMIERLLRLAAVARKPGGAPLAALLKAAGAAQITADAAGKVRELDAQGRQLVEQSGIDEPHRRGYQRKFPAQHAAEIVGVHPA